MILILGLDPSEPMSRPQVATGPQGPCWKEGPPFASPDLAALEAGSERAWHSRRLARSPPPSSGRSREAPRRRSESPACTRTQRFRLTESRASARAAGSEGRRARAVTYHWGPVDREDGNGPHGRLALQSGSPEGPIPPIGAATRNRPFLSAVPGRGTLPAMRPGCGWSARPTPGRA